MKGFPDHITYRQGFKTKTEEIYLKFLYLYSLLRFSVGMAVGGGKVSSLRGGITDVAGISCSLLSSGVCDLRNISIKNDDKLN